MPDARTARTAAIAAIGAVAERDDDSNWDLPTYGESRQNESEAPPGTGATPALGGGASEDSR